MYHVPYDLVNYVAILYDYTYIHFCTIQDGYQPIHIAVQYNQLQILHLLIKKYNVDLNTFSTPVVRL